MSGLEDYYSGDRAWAEYVNTFSDRWPDCPFKEELMAALGGDLGLAKTIYWHLEENAVGWLDARIPALGGKTPRACLRTEKGRRRLKEMIMRLPC
jgi:hypothetical protein